MLNYHSAPLGIAMKANPSTSVFFFLVWTIKLLEFTRNGSQFTHETGLTVIFKKTLRWCISTFAAKLAWDLLFFFFAKSFLLHFSLVYKISPGRGQTLWHETYFEFVTSLLQVLSHMEKKNYLKSVVPFLDVLFWKIQHCQILLVLFV